MWAHPLVVHDLAAPSLHQAAVALRKRPLRAHRLITGGHRQTILGTTTTESPALDFREVEFPLDDGASAVRAFVPADAHANARVLVVLHGLGGSVRSPYMMRVANKARRRGLTPVLVEMYASRAHGRPPVFHAGQSAGLRSVIDGVAAHIGSDDVSVLAVSLGGNIVLRMLGEDGLVNAPTTTTRVRRAVVISPLVDLLGTFRALEKQENRIYARHFLRALKSRIVDDKRHYEAHIQLDAAMAADTVRSFDSAFTAPLGGFPDVFTYYSEASAVRVMSNIDVPTLVIHAADDPLIPYEHLLRPEVRAAKNVVVAIPETGGHVGFIASDRGDDEDRRWAENRAIDFLVMATEFS